ncbi:conserved Plasmodium protein, unknown function [Plasmodium knowlesi strain H]|uniref:Uncharacterized protein n=3 Tax=Plasmodium knowlesi TaxID=5850 RepID=A0A5K1U011_PLAKH|nr:conserved Plasmodium protein, unknown function [Plasmodium knowlesi strain H]OTN63946.1 Uncharacterized protein PKNOH_S140264500 [Plasmodium knowlesi]CAA9991059.1 conserved Plasmodium protein, unknown function [Plasmodium knowlesi strain H]SBO20652.1 conserved Plasmodium protein, unknown function [Plasmodium knowlesi strain H]SBO21069.1 conserved Plasmodium protein, unknown function [Plasmodium knowlesi strain H]VVS80533.1 conserved Plasmodium protein, unknown function [Plasmodium knowlesi |eukprot:XP_002262341.1 hypothetical protein, conserved in Plasmodium species [Plasmodium knowlesi strain H]
MEIDVQCLIRALAYFTKNDDGELCEEDVNVIFNKILSQNLSHENVRELIKNVKESIQWNRSNYVENFVLTPSILHILINRQLKKHDLQTIFKDLFSCIESNGKIGKAELGKFIDLCKRNATTEDSSLSLRKFNFGVTNSGESVDYNTFLGLMEKYLKKV